MRSLPRRQITGASGGYLVAFVLAAALTGQLAERRWDRRFSSAIGAILTGNVIFLVGLPWLAVVQTLEYGSTPSSPARSSSSTSDTRNVTPS